MALAVEAENLTSAYGRKQVLRGVSLCVEEGGCVGIVGANGSGKSTLLSVLAGTLKPKSGSVFYFGQPAWTDKTGGRMRCRKEVILKMTGYVPQEDPLMPELTVYDNLRLWYPDKGKLQEELESGSLRMLGIREFLKKPVEKLSGGMKKRVSLGIALAGRPPVLILDEPSAALDLVCKEDIRDFLQEYLKKRGTVLLTTHEESELDLCNRLYVMKEGTLTEIVKDARGKELTRFF